MKWYFILAACANAQFGSFFDHIFQQQQQQQQQEIVGSNPAERVYHQIPCDKYLCPDSLQCVENQIDCPCPFPDSQLKCMLPGDISYVCISKPSNDEGPDCKFVVDAFEGKI